MPKKIYTIVFAIIILAIPFVYAIYLYPGLPESIPIHFNIKGEPDGFESKEYIFLLPSIMGIAGLFVYLLIVNLKSIDPKRYKETENLTFKNFALGVVIFLTLLSMSILYLTVHPGLSFQKILFPLLGSGFAWMGLYFPKIKQNYFIGFKLPWTLENENNWNATHQFAGKIWFYGGIIQVALAWIFSGVAVISLFFIVMLVMVLVPTFYSYRMFKKGNSNP